MEKGRVCPVERAGTLDIRLRRWFQDPRKILRPYIREGMTALDLGCGPGFFTIDMAHMVGDSGHVIAADLQEGMLRKLYKKIQGTALEERITLHKCETHRIGIREHVDFILAFYLVHEIPNQDTFFTEIESILKPEGLALVVEPPVHVSKKAFTHTVQQAEKRGLVAGEGPGIFLNKTVILAKG